MSSARSKTRVLFVCSKNQVRSLTAQQVYRSRPDLEVRSAGLKDYARAPLTSELMEWADLVFVFSPRQQRIVEARFRDVADNKRLVCLNVPDRFEYKSPELIQKLTGKLRPYLGAPAGNEGALPQQAPAREDAAGLPTSMARDVGVPPSHAFRQWQCLLSVSGDLLGEPSA